MAPTINQTPAQAATYEAAAGSSSFAGDLSVASDVNSLGRNVLGITPLADSAVGTSLLAGSKVLGGAALIVIGGSMVKTACFRGHEAAKQGHVEGVVHHALYGGMGGALTGIGGLLAAEGVATVGNIALPAGAGAAFPPLVLAMYGMQLISSAHGLVMGAKFDAKLESAKNGAYAWLIKQLEENPRALELRVGAGELDFLRSVNKFVGGTQISSNLHTALQKHAVERVKQASFKKKVTNILLLTIALVGIAIGVLLLFTPVGPLALALGILSAVTAAAWLTIDSSKINKAIGDKLWKIFGENDALQKLIEELGKEPTQAAKVMQQLYEEMGEKCWDLCGINMHLAENIYKEIAQNKTDPDSFAKSLSRHMEFLKRKDAPSKTEGKNLVPHLVRS